MPRYLLRVHTYCRAVSCYAMIRYCFASVSALSATVTLVPGVAYGAASIDVAYGAVRYFRQNFVSISYTPSSSGTGRSALKAREFDFAGSDSILDMTDPEFIKRGMKMIPAFAAAVGVVYNLDQVRWLHVSWYRREY